MDINTTEIDELRKLLLESENKVKSLDAELDDCKEKVTDLERVIEELTSDKENAEDFSSDIYGESSNGHSFEIRANGLLEAQLFERFAELVKTKNITDILNDLNKITQCG